MISVTAEVEPTAVTGNAMVPFGKIGVAAVPGVCVAKVNDGEV